MRFLRASRTRNSSLLRLTQHEGRADMSIVVEVERAVGWPRLWDLALDYGPKCVDGLRNLVRVVAFPPHASSTCPLCDRRPFPGALSCLMYSRFTQESVWAAMNFCPYYSLLPIQTQPCLNICVLWPACSENSFYLFIPCPLGLLLLLLLLLLPRPNISAEGLHFSAFHLAYCTFVLVCYTRNAKRHRKLQVTST